MTNWNNLEGRRRSILQTYFLVTFEVSSVGFTLRGEVFKALWVEKVHNPLRFFEMMAKGILLIACFLVLSVVQLYVIGINGFNKS